MQATIAVIFRPRYSDSIRSHKGHHVNSEYLAARIAATEAAIEAYEGAALALGTGGLQSYTLDTGQNRTVVTRLDVSAINATIDSLYNRLATLTARRTGAGVVRARPAW